jgi:hypothetical protein
VAEDTAVAAGVGEELGVPETLLAADGVALAGAEPVGDAVALLETSGTGEIPPPPPPEHAANAAATKTKNSGTRRGRLIEWILLTIRGFRALVGSRPRDTQLRRIPIGAWSRTAQEVAVLGAFLG